MAKTNKNFCINLVVAEEFTEYCNSRGIKASFLVENMIKKFLEEMKDERAIRVPSKKHS